MTHSFAMGLYLITDNNLETAKLLSVVEAALKGQTKIIQYRDKSTDSQKRQIGRASCRERV